MDLNNKPTYTILIDARSLRSTTGRYMRELLNGLQKIDTLNKYLVVVNPEDEEHWQPSNDNFSLEIVPWKPYSFGEQFGLLFFLKNKAPDLIHFTMPQQPTLLRSPKITTIHDLTLANFKDPNKNLFTYSIKQWLFRLVLKRAAKSSELILTDAEYTKKKISAYTKISSEHIMVAYPAADALNSKPEQFKAAENKKFIMHVGNTFSYKNIDRLMKAHQQLLETNPNIYLLLVGKIDNDALRHKKIAKENNYKQILFTGFVSDAELSWLYNNASAYVFPSLSEGFGMPGLEAMNHGLPVVSSNATCLPEIYGDAAHYFNPKDIKDMASAINEVLNNTRLRKHLVTNSKKQTNKYSWNTMAEQIHTHYLNTLKNLEID